MHMYNVISLYWNFYQLAATNDEHLKQLIEQATHQLSADNTELACAFIQKTAVEKVLPEVEKRLAEASAHWLNYFVKYQ